MRTFARSQMSGNIMGWLMSRFRWMMSSGLEFGTTFLVQLMIQLLTVELWLQINKAWRQSSSWSEVQREHAGLSLWWRWCSLELVGRMTHHMLHIYIFHALVLALVHVLLPSHLTILFKTPVVTLSIMIYWHSNISYQYRYFSSTHDLLNTFF